MMRKNAFRFDAMKDPLDDRWDIPFWLALGGILLIVGLLFVSATRARAGASEFRSNDPVLKKWFDDLKNDRGESCCFDWDGLGVDDIDWRRREQFELRHGGKWTAVPDDLVVKEPNRVKRAIVWYRPDGSIRCFLPGSMG